MKKVRVNLDTMKRLNTFVKICETQNYLVYLTDGSKQFRVSAKSTLGCILAQIEWEEIYCEYEAQYGNTLERLLAQNDLVIY
jgi:hypothetical protein